MDGLFNLLKPALFKSVKDGDPEALLQDFEEYVEILKKFFTTTGAAGQHTAEHTACGTGYLQERHCGPDQSVHGSLQVDDGKATSRMSVLRLVAKG